MAVGKRSQPLCHPRIPRNNPDHSSPTLTHQIHIECWFNSDSSCSYRKSKHQWYINHMDQRPGPLSLSWLIPSSSSEFPCATPKTFFSTCLNKSVAVFTWPNFVPVVNPWVVLTMGNEWSCSISFESYWFSSGKVKVQLLKIWVNTLPSWNLNWNLDEGGMATRLVPHWPSSFNGSFKTCCKIFVKPKNKLYKLWNVCIIALGFPYP